MQSTRSRFSERYVWQHLPKLIFFLLTHVIMLCLIPCLSRYHSDRKLCQVLLSRFHIHQYDAYPDAVHGDSTGTLFALFVYGLRLAPIYFLQPFLCSSNLNEPLRSLVPFTTYFTNQHITSMSPGSSTALNIFMLRTIRSKQLSNTPRPFTAGLESPGGCSLL